MWFSVDNLVLVRAGRLHRRAGNRLARVGGALPHRAAWALVLPLSIAVVVAAIGWCPRPPTR